MVEAAQGSPREVVERLFRELPTRNAEAFAAAFAPDGVFEMPFMPDGVPVRLVGPEEIRKHLGERWSRISQVQVHGVHPHIHETTDPEVIVVENDVDVSYPGAERTVVRSSVNVVRVRDGKVTLFRDYMDSARLARAAASR
ncbi:nuclear transport factor 2 family protein [Nocardia arthritidis]|uniref:Nuclear transport factor 2 family protein n=1 Tax=Nocardia arthritidis TaxID=228602 RepID=A0A6G9Y4Z7_9NOCA|nr:nuclear transport factor 2 family protein [Nocardia arthritidis]QIS08279.1 nuclear transport factor 2 family protein [Nocardia arthritidis]